MREPKFLSRDDWAKEPTEAPLRKFIVPAIRLLEKDDDTGMHDVEFVISSGAVDRENDIIATDGWELEAYKQNPIVLWSHDYRTLPIGRSMAIGEKEGKLVSVNRFTPREVNPLGATVYEMIKGGFLRAASVGFRPLKYSINEERRGYDFEQQELLEHSVVSVPANPEALAAAKSAGIDLAPLREWAETVLDADPELLRVTNYVPRAAIEEAWKETAPTSVAAMQMSSGTSGGLDFQTTTGTADHITWYERNTTNPAWDSYKQWVKIDYEWPKTNEPEEVDMEELTKLTEAVDGLRDDLTSVKEAVETILKELVEPEPEPEPEVSLDEVKDMVKQRLEEAEIAKTGKLPD